ncbi:ABC transporter ATP-binding protein [Paenibacillus borealis]|uniref:ABC transporter ATP-binding protein n=1 Tax=Paenibacillus borealis TaxID=160799 RepID=A0A089MKA0_PAEBO|nr:ABC transporter ATP-binding protein [Paenibacillus borealis]AIQ56959.1 hypothetical protein PBOR_08465 [Paenibacillus borealis]
MRKLISILRLHIYGYKAYLIVAFILIFLVSFINMSHQYVFGILIDQLYYSKKIDVFLWIILAYLLVFLLGQAMHLGINYIWAKLQMGFLYNIRLNMFNKILSSKLAESERYDTGDLLKRINYDCGEIVSLIYHNIFYTLANTTKLLFGIGMMCYLNIEVGIVSIIIIPIITILTSKIKKNIKKEQASFHENESKLNTQLLEYAYSLNEIILQQAGDFFRKRILQTNKTVKQNDGNLLQLTNKHDVITECLLQGANVIIFFMASYYIIAGTSTVGQLVSLIAYFNTCKSLFRGLYQRRNLIARNILAIERVLDILMLESEIVHSSELQLKNVHSINAEKLGFHYKDNEDIINNFSLTLNEKGWVGLQGDNGKGKTTLLKLLIGLYHPTDGILTINDVSITEFTLKSIRDNIGVVWQESFVINDTIRDNILLGKENVSDEELNTLLKQVKLEKVISSLPDGLNTKLGTDGQSLSGGQLQRLMIARVLLNKPSILVLDEATSALDMDTENSVLNELLNIYQDKMIIWISHYNRNAHLCNKIVDIKAVGHE